MALFGNQFANVVEWEEYRDDQIFWKWTNREIKKGSRLVLKPGQDAVFLYDGKYAGVFSDSGSYDIESQIIPFLSTLKGIKFGFNSGHRSEVLFVNTKEFLVNWGTQNPVLLKVPELPGGMPISAHGTFSFKVDDYMVLIEKIAGVKNSFVVGDVKAKIMASLNGLLMKHIIAVGQDMFNLQANVMEIGSGIRDDLDMGMMKNGITITEFNVSSFSYPEEVEKMQRKVASHSMVGDLGRYQSIEMTNGITSGNVKGGGVASDMAGMMMGMGMAQQMMGSMAGQHQGMAGMDAGNQPNGAIPKFCPNCGTPTNGMKFCGNCGFKLG